MKGNIKNAGLLIALCVLLSAVDFTAHASEPDAAPRLTRSIQSEDIAFFRQRFLNIDRSYSDAARATARERLAKLEQKAGDISPETFIIEICAITALADNGHSQCFLPKGDETQIGFTPFDGRFFVTSIASSHAGLLGTELVGIDGHSISTVRADLRKCRGGVMATRDLFAVKFLNRPDLLHSLGLASSAEAAVYQLRSADGHMMEQYLATTHASSKLAVLPGTDKTPWSLRDPDQPFRWRDVPELDAVMIQLRQNIDSETQKILQFLSTTDAERIRLRRRNVILDMRQNWGGDFLLTRDFMIAWPHAVGLTGRIFVLVGPGTFSAGIVGTAYLKQAGKDRVLLVGEPPGDRMTYFAEGQVFVLPHSGIGVLPATERDDLAGGCHPYTDCFGALAQFGFPTGSSPEKRAIIDRIYGRKPLEVRSLDPDIPAPWTIQDYLSGQDPAIEAVKQWLSAGF
jgi:hypothetical protein